ncbi:hypothetical protein ACJMK2_027371 [Sinanodonta woodiana]|uniref:Uncharacterized protein n=1 Tax=Sinanodonta woodiana TaxID=1069815 RepID=A0ABD3XMK6_SINWO
MDKVYPAGLVSLCPTHLSSVGCRAVSLVVVGPLVVVYTNLIVTLNQINQVYVNDGGILSLTCDVNQNTGFSSVVFRREINDKVIIANITSCSFFKADPDDSSTYNVTCTGQKAFTMVKYGINSSDHNKRWSCLLISKTSEGPCSGVNNPCISPDVTVIIIVPVTTVQLTNGSGQVLHLSANIVRGESTGIICSTAPNGSRPRALFQWYYRQGNQSPVLIVDQSISTTPDPITVPGQSDILISYSTWRLTGNASYHNMYIYCQAQDETNTGNYTKSDEVHLNIVYPPFVQLYTYQSVVTEGMQGLVFICNIIESNPLPNSYSWFHNRSIIQGQTSSNYTLQTVQKSDAGQYMCTARNYYGEGASNSLDLIVQYGAEIKDFSVQRGTTVNESESATFQCSVDSCPKSVITLRRESDGMMLKTVVNASQVQYWVQSANCLDADNYTCSASNNISQPAVRTIQFFVKCHPRLDFLVPFVNVTYSKYLGDAVLRYTVISYPPPRFTWTFLGNGSESSDLPNSAKQFDYGQQSELRFRRLDTSDFGSYRVTADNTINEPATAILWLLIRGTPDKPFNFHPTNIQKKQLSLRWQAGYDEGYTQTFIVEISLDNITWNNVSQVSAGNKDGWFTTIIEDLISGSEYYFRLYAYNINGRGDFADVQLAIRTLTVETKHSSLLDVSASAGVGAGGAAGIGVGGIALGLIGAIIAFTIRRQLNVNQIE